jgi:hypothetical protein
VKRRITNKYGKRYNDDMNVVTGNAACSIAIREAVFKVVPRSLFKDIFDAAKDTSLGKAKTMAERRESAFGWFEKAGVTRERILERLGRKGMDDVSVDDLLTLTGMRTAIKDGDMALDEAFPVNGATPPSERAAAAETNLREAAAAKRGAARGDYADLERAGLQGDAPSASVVAPAVDIGAATVMWSDAEEQFLALVMDTPRGTGRKPLANDVQRGRLRELAGIVSAGGAEDAAVRLSGLADDANLAAAQAVGILLQAVNANLLAGGDQPAAADGGAP